MTPALILACVFGFLLAVGIGANDLANITSPVVGSRALRVSRATIIAIIFEILGALWGSHQVSLTLKEGLIQHSILSDSGVGIQLMLSVLITGATWTLLASRLGMPVSITHAIVGAIVGLGVIRFGGAAIYWHTVGMVGLTWLLAPIVSAGLAYTLFRSIANLILEAAEPVRRAQIHLPFYGFLIGLILVNMMLLKGLAHFGVHLTPLQGSILALGLSGAFAIFLAVMMRRYPIPSSLRGQFVWVEKAFRGLMVATICAMIFGHGANDIAIAVGPVLAVYGLTHQLHISYSHQQAIVALMCLGAILGYIFHGRKVLLTVGTRITALTPSRAFAATLAAALVILISTGLGVPTSATQSLVGAVLGVGLARGIGALNLTVVRHILLSWLVTLPATALLSVGYFVVLKILFERYL